MRSDRQVRETCPRRTCTCRFVICKLVSQLLQISRNTSYDFNQPKQILLSVGCWFRDMAKWSYVQMFFEMNRMILLCGVWARFSQWQLKGIPKTNVCSVATFSGAMLNCLLTQIASQPMAANRLQIGEEAQMSII